MKRQRTSPPTTSVAAATLAALSAAGGARLPSPAVVVPLIILKQAKADEDGGSRPNCFCHGWKDCHRFSAARVLGIVVEVQRDRFIIDDGTATATILRPPTLDAENGRSASDHAAAHGNGGAAAAASPPPPAASEPSADPPTHPKVGDLVECYGDLTEDRAVAAEAFAVQTDPMYEPMRWLEQLDLHNRLYSRPPAAAMSAAAAATTADADVARRRSGAGAGAGGVTKSPGSIAFAATAAAAAAITNAAARAAPPDQLDWNAGGGGGGGGGSDGDGEDMLTSSQQEDADIEAAMMDALIPSQTSSLGTSSQQNQHEHHQHEHTEDGENPQQQQQHGHDRENENGQHENEADMYQSPRAAAMSQDLITIGSQPTSKHADELDGFIRAAGAVGVELSDLMLNFCPSSMKEAELRSGLKDLLTYGVVYDTDGRYFSL